MVKGHRAGAAIPRSMIAIATMAGRVRVRVFIEWVLASARGIACAAEFLVGICSEP
jgi:hypothetical protein